MGLKKEEPIMVIMLSLAETTENIAPVSVGK